MFEYYKGYEIDGSDTSYDLLTPNFEKLKEMFLYFINLDVINKSKPITVINIGTLNSKVHRKEIERDLIGKQYTIENYDELFNDILKYDLSSVTFKYYYVAVEKLSLKLKKELIDLLLNSSLETKSLKYNKPVIDSRWWNLDNGNFETQKDQITMFSSSKAWLDTCFKPIDYDSEKVANSYNINFTVSTIQGNVSPCLAYYVLEKISKRFLEYNINAFEDFQELNCCGKIDVKRDVSESMNVSIEEARYLLKYHKIKFFSEMEESFDEVYLDNLYQYVDTFNENMYNYDREIYYEAIDSLIFEDNKHLLGKQIYQKEYNLYNFIKQNINSDSEHLTISEYLKFCQSIAEFNNLSNLEIKKFTTIYFEFEKNNDDTQHICKIRLNVDNGEKYFELIYPHDCKGEIERILKRR